MIDLGEEIAAGLVAKINREIGAFITQKNAQAAVIADGISVTAPLQVLDYVPPLEIQRAWPLVGVAHERSILEDDTGWSATGVHPFVICTFVQRPDQQGITRLIKRLTTCVVAAAIDGRTIPTADETDTAAWGVRLREVRWGPTLADVPESGREPEAWITWSEAVIECRTDEDA